MNFELFSAYLVIALLVLLTPGPIVTFVLATAATRGTRAAMIAVSGTLVGTSLLICLIALGLGFVLKYAGQLFDILRYAGAAYLIWLGIQAWRNASKIDLAAPPRDRVHFGRGFMVAIANPKTIMFFTAFLPQFIDPSLPAGFQLTVMCVVWIVMAAATDSIWAIAGGYGRSYFLNPVRAKWLGRTSGVALIGGGVWLSLARRPG